MHTDFIKICKNTAYLKENFNQLLCEIKKRQSIASANGKNQILLDDVYAIWIAEVRLIAKPNTIIKYESVYKNHICRLRNVPVAEIDKSTINSFTQYLQTKGLCNKTINDILIVLNSLLCYAAAEYSIRTPKIRYLKEEHKEPRCLTMAEQKKLICYLSQDTDTHKFGVLLALYTGIRIGELCALRWEDITGGTIVINKTMTRVCNNGKSKVITHTPKSESSVRAIPLPTELCSYCNELRGSGYVLSTKKLTYTEPRYMQMIFDKYVKDCGLQGVTFHTLRHTFATRCIEAGVDAKTLSELLGHSDTKITLNRYVHSSFDLKRNSIEKMQNLIA